MRYIMIMSTVFDWPYPMPLTLHAAQNLGLVKGSLMQEGKLRSGDIMTRDNIMHGAGALRAVSSAGVALVDIDHFAEKLPTSYAEKYGAGINDPYPVGHVIDAQAVIVNDLAQVQALMIIHNPLVYNLVTRGLIKGNSVVDLPRKKVCDDTCKFEGSAYLMNTLVLEGEPNSFGTWTAPINEDDIGTIIQHNEKSHTVDSIITRLINRRLEAIAAV